MHRTLITLVSILTLASTLAPAREVKYSIAPGFFEQNPGGQPLGPCHGGVVIDKAGNIYVSTDTERGLVVFSPQGKFLRAVGPIRIHGLELKSEKGGEYIYAARPSDHDLLGGEQVLWRLEGQLESALTEPLSPDYKELVAAARKEVRGSQH